MKKLIAGLLAIGLLMISGCVPSYTPSTNMPATNAPSIPSASNGASDGVAAPSNSEPTILPNEPPKDRTWISPGKVQVGNFHPGARAEWTMQVHNGNDTQASFLVTYRYPDHVGEGYVKPAEEVQDWVIIADPTPIIAPKETKEILIALDMPEDAIVFAPKWEFWISVKDTTQSGMVQTELCSRWLVTMR